MLIGYKIDVWDKKISCTSIFVKAELFEIIPEIPYTNADLNWMNQKSRSSIEMKTYDEIVLGFPIWWYVAPTIINTFLEKYDFSDKRIILFATSGGSGFGNTVRELKPSAPDSMMEKGVKHGVCKIRKYRYQSVESLFRLHEFWKSRNDA